MNNGRITGNISTIALVTLSLAVLAIGGAALFVTSARHGGERGLVATTTVALASTTVATTSTPAESVVAQKKSAAPPRFALCTANDLTGMADWQSTGRSLAGDLSITNSSRASCSLSHDDYLQIMSDDQVLPVSQATNTTAGAYEDLSPGSRADLRFLWSNWCGESLLAPAYVRLILPKNGGYLRVPLIDPGGHPRSETPRCDAPGAYSSVSIWR